MAGLFGPAVRIGYGVAVFCALCCPTPAVAESLDERLVTDAADGKLDEYDFLSAALIAGGVSDGCELEHWRRTYAELRATALVAAHSNKANEKLAAIQAALHERILVGSYQTAASDLRTTIARGDYNCLTALAVYWDLCNAAGMPLAICASPGHVCLRTADGEWIEPATNRRLMSHRPRSSFTRRLTPTELLGKFYYNRGVEQLRTGQFAAGLALVQISLQLDPADADAARESAGRSQQLGRRALPRTSATTWQRR